MKTAPISSRASGARASQSLYGTSAISGKRQLRASKLDGRKSLFKPPQNVLKPTRNSTIQNGFTKRIVLDSKNSLVLSKALSSLTDVQKLSNMNKTFLRPSVDIWSVRKTLLERSQRLAEIRSVKSDEADSKPSQSPVRMISKIHTPKPSVKAKAFHILSEARKRTAQKTVAVVPKMPGDDEGIIHRKSIVGAQKDLVKMSDLKENVIPNAFSPSPMKEFLKPVAKEQLHKVNLDATSSTHCALNNILKYCQLYNVKMSSMNDAIYQLDDSFQRVMVGEVGGEILEKFCSYQKRKLDLYRQMRLVEEQLEEALTAELDLRSKFKEYLRKREDIFRERSTMQAEFESTVNKMLEIYQEELNKQPKTFDLDEITHSLLSHEIREKNSPGIQSVEAIPGKSGRLKTPKKVFGSPRVLRSHSKKNSQEDFIVKKTLKSTDKQVQQSIYKDLQKGFNLCSPECSF